MYAGQIKDPVFNEYAALKKRLKEAIEKTVDFYNVNARFTLRIPTERDDNIVFEPAMLKFRRISSGTSVTISGDILHIAVAEFPDVSEKIQKLNAELVEKGEEPLPIPDPSEPGEYIRKILEIYEAFENKKIRLKLP